MKQRISALLAQAIANLQKKGVLDTSIAVTPMVEHARDRRFGDFATNVALTVAKSAGFSPREFAEKLIAELPASDFIAEVSIAGPGFINFKLKESAQTACIADILSLKENYGRTQLGEGKKIILEFISANPTGPLHVGHGRGAAYGATLANLLTEAGFKVHREYYVNDAGRQMNILAASVWLRYLELCGESFTFPCNGYVGAYVIDIAIKLFNQYQREFCHPASTVFANIPDDEPQGGDKEKHIDALIAKAQQLLGESAFDLIHKMGLNDILDDMRDDLAEFGVVFDEWFSEASLLKSGAMQRGIDQLRKSGHVYEQDGAQWFNAMYFGDEKDRVLIRANGQPTYFASDVAYHFNKFERGFDRLIDIFGSDHHGYVTRVKASVKALGKNPDLVDVLLVQFAILWRGAEKVSMSTRGGQFVTLRQLRQDVGNDAARFFYVMRKIEQHLDFDLDLAKSQSNENPVYYIQYAHARICSVLRQLDEKGIKYNETNGLDHLDQLNTEHEQALIQRLQRYPEVIVTSAKAYEPHQLTQYCRELAQDFHTYYNAHQFIVDDENLRNARLCLIISTQHVLKNSLRIIGVSAPEQM